MTAVFFAAYRKRFTTNSVGICIFKTYGERGRGGHNGATFKAEYKVVDVMKLFAPVYGVWSEERNDYKWQKLTTAAEYYGYDWSKRAETAHNSLGDCFATLFVYENINRL